MPPTIPGVRECLLTLAVMAVAFTAIVLRPDRGREPVSPDAAYQEASR